MPLQHLVYPDRVLRGSSTENADYLRCPSQLGYIPHLDQGRIRIPHRDKALVHQQFPALRKRHVTDVCRIRPLHFTNGFQGKGNITESLFLAVPGNAIQRQVADTDQRPVTA